jgi:hypothetical protein
MTTLNFDYVLKINELIGAANQRSLRIVYHYSGKDNGAGYIYQSKSTLTI